MIKKDLIVEPVYFSKFSASGKCNGIPSGVGMNSCHKNHGINSKSGCNFEKPFSEIETAPQGPVFLPIHCSTLQFQEVFAGEASTEWHQYGHDAELEWCLIFSRPITRLQITKNLGCMLQGSIRERVLWPAGRSESGEVIPGSRSIIAMIIDDYSGYFGGVPTTLDEIHSGQTGASMRLEYHKENNEGKVERTLSSSILARMDLVSVLRKIQDNAAGNRQKDGNVIRLTAVYRHGGYLQERWLKYQSALTAVKGVHYSTIANTTIKSRLMTDVIERREYIQRGTEARLNVIDSANVCVGRSVLKVL